MFSLFHKKGDKKAKTDTRPIRSLFWVGAFLFLISFVILLPIYKTANMTSAQHMSEGLTALQEQKYAKAKTHLLRAAQTQNAEAFYTLAIMELEGKNDNKKANPTEAAVYFENAANLGLNDAQYALALLYDRGEGVTQDRKKALDWTLLAAAQGNVEAIYASAVWLERGYSGNPEPILALNFYELAASKGHQKAMTSLISIYAGGTDIPANKERAEFFKTQLDNLRTKKNNKK